MRPKDDTAIVAADDVEVLEQYLGLAEQMGLSACRPAEQDGPPAKQVALAKEERSLLKAVHVLLPVTPPVVAYGMEAEWDETLEGVDKAEDAEAAEATAKAPMLAETMEAAETAEVEALVGGDADACARACVRRAPMTRTCLGGRFRAGRRLGARTRRGGCFSAAGQRPFRRSRMLRPWRRRKGFGRFSRPGWSGEQILRPSPIVWQADRRGGRWWGEVGWGWGWGVGGQIGS